MAKTLVVVESPAKAKTIKKYLGSGYEVKASVGHVKDLPERSGKGFGFAEAFAGPIVGVDVEAGFRPHYVVIPGKEKIIHGLQEAAKKAGKILLATDPDREGEAIAWHLKEELNKPDEQVYRVLFNELTERTIKEAIASPARLDENKYNAQQARRILDRIVGYRLSPLLWEKVRYGLSAGRVQSVALRMIVDRQNAIDTFVPQEYWSITAALAAQSPPDFEAKLAERNGRKLTIGDAAEAAELVGIARSNPFKVIDVTRRERTKKPMPPFITSTLQQEASRRLKMPGTRTMRIAQQLYEGIELGEQGSVGLITYMRTDSPRIAPEALSAVRQYLKDQYGPKYVPDRPHVYKGRKSAQEAHEAIRPTSMDLSPDKVSRFLDKGQLALYTLIWNRFVASQAAPAVYDQTTARIGCAELIFKVTGSVMKFDGFLRIYSQEKDNDSEVKNGEKEDVDRELPSLKTGDVLVLKRLSPRQHFTQPPAPFNEASLIKELEEQGIGRPSTYAETVSTIQKRQYVELQEGRFRPTVLGRIIAGLLVDSFPELLNTRFTAEMESSLDLIEEGSTSWIKTLQDFYGPFQSALQQARTGMKNIRREGVPTGESCPRCGESLLLRSGRYGLFMGCSTYPECDYTVNISKEKAPTKEPKPSGETCECGAPMVIREGRSGPFLSCSRYPECKIARPLSTGVRCPKCEVGEMAERRSKKGRKFFSCYRYPQCDYSLWNRPVGVACPNPKCNSPIMEERFNKGGSSFLQCPQCKHRVENKQEGSLAADSRSTTH
ncbi:MAG: type I DNA topoisomerase [Deltaproteobacteria bacterium]|nr:type I DNA topoisomerase [Deltaproteobacteria bacterium]